MNKTAAFERDSVAVLICFGSGRSLPSFTTKSVQHAMDLAYIPVIITDACGSGNQIAADRSLASLATFGGSLQTDTAAIIRLLRQASAPIELN